MTDLQYTKAQTFWIRKDETENKMDPVAIYAWLDSFLFSHKVLALATGAGNYVRCTPLEYTGHNDALWIFTEGGLKFKGLKGKKNVAAAIFETNTSFGGLKSLQIEGADVAP